MRDLTSGTEIPCGWVYDAETGTFTEPPPPPEPELAEPVEPAPPGDEEYEK